MYQDKNGNLVFPVEAGVSVTQDDRKARHLVQIRKASKGGPLAGSTSEVLMMAFALRRWDEAPEGWRNDPWAAWIRRLDDSERAAVEEWRETHE